MTDKEKLNIFYSNYPTAFEFADGGNFDDNADYFSISKKVIEELQSKLDEIDYYEQQNKQLQAKIDKVIEELEDEGIDIDKVYKILKEGNE